MNFIDEYRDQALARAIINQIYEIKEDIPGSLTFMEVCGTHTVALSRYGIRELLPEDLKIISGPGCPVCVTPIGEVEAAINLANKEEVILTTYGDMMKVPGSSSSLQEIKASGKDIRVVYSVMDALEIAKKNPYREVVFLGIGFETTAPASAVAIYSASQKGIKNFSLLCCHKLIPPALQALLADTKINLDGFICPGHVSVIIGALAYEPVSKAGKAAVVTGFEPLDILEGVWLLLKQIREQSYRVDIQYSRAVTWKGNQKAQEQIERIFNPCSALWRGIGAIPESGLEIKEGFSQYDASKRFSIHIEPIKDPPGCCCGEILRGKRLPLECPLFGKTCTPSTPVGPCMVSSEGACAVYYKYSHKSQ